jgi:hypothetical protein
MCANIGVIIGPMLGGLTSDPAANYPSLFGGVKWLEKFPYSPPNLLSALFLFTAVLAVFFGLEEVRAQSQIENCTHLLDTSKFQPQRWHWNSDQEKDFFFI